MDIFLGARDTQFSGDCMPFMLQQSGNAFLGSEKFSVKHDKLHLMNAKRGQVEAIRGGGKIL